MASRIIGMILGVAAVGVLVGALVFGLRPQAQEAGEEEQSEKVTPEELNLYISVYTAMQADHDLTLDTLLAQKNVPLEQFRNIERRIQKQDRLVEKVREALSAQSKAKAEALGPALAQQPPAPPTRAAPGHP
jgi:hypothetical protein